MSPIVSPIAGCGRSGEIGGSCVHTIGVVGLGFVLVLRGRNECWRLDLVYEIKEGLDKGLMVRASLDLLLLLVNSDSTETVSRKRESLSLCDASGKMIPMWFDVPFASHTRLFQWCAFVC